MKTTLLAPLTLCLLAAASPLLSRVQAPYKRGVWFERSAPMMPWEEPGKMLVSLLTYVRLWRRPARCLPRHRRSLYSASALLVR